MEMLEKESAVLVDCVLRKLEKFTTDNESKLDKAASLKTLVLLLKPLEEAINICGLKSTHLPQDWQ
jgi:hypothetical protein